MNAISLGPLVLAGDRLAIVLGILAFLIVTTLISTRVEGRFDRWSWWSLIGGLVAARLVHVLANWRNFLAEPERILAVWDGSFFWPAAILTALIAMFIILKSVQERLWAALPLALGLIIWNITAQLTGSAQIIDLPQATYQTLSGEQHVLDKADGRPKIINLWASWCPPCRREMPMMAELAASETGADFIFANQGEGSERIKLYLEQAGLSLGTVVLDQASSLGRHYRSPGLPVTLFIGADGMLRHAHLGEISRETLQSRLARLLQEP